MKNYRFLQNVSLDAALVHAAMNGLFDAAAIQFGLTPSETYFRAFWLKRLSEFYIKKVSDRVVEIEKESPHAP